MALWPPRYLNPHCVHPVGRIPRCPSARSDTVHRSLASTVQIRVSCCRCRCGYLNHVSLLSDLDSRVRCCAVCGREPILVGETIVHGRTNSPPTTLRTHSHAPSLHRFHRDAAPYPAAFASDGARQPRRCIFELGRAPQPLLRYQEKDFFRAHVSSCTGLQAVARKQPLRDVGY